jgi:hypothetical protein
MLRSVKLVFRMKRHLSIIKNEILPKVARLGVNPEVIEVKRLKVRFIPVLYHYSG